MLADTEQAIRTTGLTFEELLERQLSSAEAQGPFTPGSYVKERFYTPRGGQTPAAPRAWEIDEVDEDQQSDDDDQFEKNVLTPVRLANQRQWNSIQQEHAERLCAFEQIERMIFETSDDGPGQQSLPKDIRHSTHETRYPSTAYPSIARRAPSMNDLTLGRINEVSLTRSRSTGDFPIKEHEVPDGLNRLIEDHENDIPSVMSNATIIAKRAQSPEGKSNIPTVVRSENKFGWNSTQGHNSGDGVSDEDSKSILRPVKLAEAQTPAPSKLLYNLFPGLRPKTEIPARKAFACHR
ncbi:hypothetical protein DFS34DRAFT_70685 [Phlyctochytrium arcticum]|nr:hypothetical protein DFS34DRAFT_70685 [Phlyctochytrium arcticum]